MGGGRWPARPRSVRPEDVARAARDVHRGLDVGALVADGDDGRVGGQRPDPQRAGEDQEAQEREEETTAARLVHGGDPLDPRLRERVPHGGVGYAPPSRERS